MATIKKNFTTDATASEMKLYINQKILTRSELKALFESAVWVGYTLNIESKLGSGTVVLQDNLVEVVINLSFFGKIAAKQIESGIDIGFKQLQGK